MACEILIVDDNDFVAGALVELLRFKGYLPLRAHNPHEAEALFRVHPPRAVLTDNRMADDIENTDGLTFARWVKNQSPETPVIMLSALPPDEADGVCDRVLCKPVSVRDIVAALTDVGVPASAGDALRSP